MRKRDLLFFSYRNLMSKKGMILLIILNIIMVVFLTFMLFLIRQPLRIRRELEQIDKNLPQTLYNYSFWHDQGDLTQEEENYVLDQLKELNLSPFSFEGYFGVADGMEGVWQIQKAEIMEYTECEDPSFSPVSSYSEEELGKIFHCLLATDSLVTSMNLRIEYTENIPDTSKYRFVYPLYVGEKLKDMLPAERLYIDGRFCYYIAGYIASGQVLPAESIKYLQANSLHAVIPLDYEVLELGMRFNNINGMLRCESREQADELETLLEKMYQDKHIRGELGQLEDYLQKIESDSSRENELYTQIVLSVGLLLVSSLILIQFLEFDVDKKKYGIWYANGIGTGTQSAILFLQNVWFAVIGLVLSVPALITLLSISYASATMTRIMSAFLFRYIFPKVAVLVFAVYLISGLLPVFVFRKKKPIELLGGLRE